MSKEFGQDLTQLSDEELTRRVIVQNQSLIAELDQEARALKIKSAPYDPDILKTPVYVGDAFCGLSPKLSPLWKNKSER